MRVDWCVSSWFRIKNTHSLTHSEALWRETEGGGGGPGGGRETGSVAGSPDRTRRGVERVVAWCVAHMDHGIPIPPFHAYDAE